MLSQILSTTAQTDKGDAAELLDVRAACRLLGGTRPIHPATLWRGVQAGRYPRPIRLGRAARWVKAECLAVIAAAIAERDSEPAA